MKYPKKQTNYWISLSDIMTGLMMIFLFIAISYMIQVKAEQDEKDQFIKEYIQTRIELYEELKLEFEEDFKPENWNVVLDKDLSIKFLNERVLFDYDKAELKPEFKNILDEFFPRYLNILLKDKYRSKIAEVRIEGHSDSRGDYYYNVWLSQNRTRNVLKYLMTKSIRKAGELTEKENELLRFWLTANGFSFGRTIDSNREYTLFSGNPVNNEFSRRVEFRIITASEKVISDFMNLVEKN